MSEPLKHWEKKKGDGKHPAGKRWLMQTRGGGQWVTQGRYTEEEIVTWDFAFPIAVEIEDGEE